MNLSGLYEHKCHSFWFFSRGNENQEEVKKMFVLHKPAHAAPVQHPSHAQGIGIVQWHSQIALGTLSGQRSPTKDMCLGCSFRERELCTAGFSLANHHPVWGPRTEQLTWGKRIWKSASLLHLQASFAGPHLFCSLIKDATLPGCHKKRHRWS